MFNQKIQNYLAQQMGSRNPQFNPAFFTNSQFMMNNQSMNPQSINAMNMQPMFGSPMFADPAQYVQQQQQAQLQMNQMQLLQQSQAQAQNQSMMQPQSPRNASYRQAPYSMQSPRQQQQGFQSSHSRSQSIAIPKHLTNTSPQISPVELSSDRRNSEPVVPLSKQIKTESSNSSTDGSAPVSPSKQLRKKPSFPDGHFKKTLSPFDPAFTAASQADQSGIQNPFTTEMSAASQQMMGYMNNDLMNFTCNKGIPTYNSFSDTGKAQSQQSYPSMNGLNSTLAPPSSSQEPAPEYRDFNSENFFNEAYSANNGYGSVNGTPGVYNEDFNNIFDMHAYEDPTSTQ